MCSLVGGDPAFPFVFNSLRFLCILLADRLPVEIMFDARASEDKESGKKRHQNLEDDLVVRCRGPAHPQGELTGISLHMLCYSKF